MLIVITPENRQHYLELLTDMCTENGLTNSFASTFCATAKDAFESIPEAVYFVYIDDRYDVQGYARLLPTTGKHLCSEKCGDLTPTGDHIWELSSIQIMVPEDSVLLESEVAFTTISTLFFHELFEALNSFCVFQKINQILVVGDSENLKSLQQIGWPLENTSLQLYPEIHADLPSEKSVNMLLIHSLSMTGEAYRQFELDREQFINHLHMDMKSSLSSLMVH